MDSATLRDQLRQLRKAEPRITQAEAARRLGVSRAHVSVLAQEMGLKFRRKPARRGICAACGRTRLFKRDRLCAECEINEVDKLMRATVT